MGTALPAAPQSAVECTSAAGQSTWSAPDARISPNRPSSSDVRPCTAHSGAPRAAVRARMHRALVSPTLQAGVGGGAAAIAQPTHIMPPAHAPVTAPAASHPVKRDTTPTHLVQLVSCPCAAHQQQAAHGGGEGGGGGCGWQAPACKEVQHLCRLGNVGHQQRVGQAQVDQRDGCSSKGEGGQQE